MWKWILGAVLVVLVLCGGYWYLSMTPARQSSAEAEATSTTVALTTPTATTTTNATIYNSTEHQPMTATLHTNKGDISIQLFATLAPNTVANFSKLAQEGFYSGVKFHRVIKGFMDQAGDPLTKDDSMQARWGTGGPGYTIPDEITPEGINMAGTIAMANTGQPNSAGSQFFINAVDNHFLDGKYTVFGKVTSGMDVVTAINNVQTDSNDRPIDPVVIQSITISQ